MFDVQKSSGSGLTTTIAYLVVAFVFSPIVLIMSRPFGYGLLTAAVICSVVCVAMALISWRRSSPDSLLRK
jgi:hypothetical protein